MSQLKRIVRAKRMAANQSVALQSTCPRDQGRSTDIDSKRLIGFGLALATADSKKLIGFGEFALILASHLFYDSCDETTCGKNENFRERQERKFFDGRSLRLL